MRYANRVAHVKQGGQDLVELMNFSGIPNLINFSGGFPSPETYPIDDIKETMIEIMQDDARGALSYSPSAGYPELRRQIAGRMKDKYGLSFGEDEVLLVSGSQQALDLSGMLFIDPGDVILFESPSYLGALSALKSYEARLVAIDGDEEGMKIDELKNAFETYNDKIKLIYVNTDYQNPTGRCWSEERRAAFMRFVETRDVAVLDDGAYAELSFAERPMKPLISYDKKGQVIYIGTFSKTFCPGLRTGWICCTKDVLENYLILKANTDLSPATILQRQVSYYLKNRDMDGHIAKIRELYKKRRDVMYEAIEREFPKDAKYDLPQGGLFFWVRLPDSIDTRALLTEAIKQKVAFMPGGAFYPEARRNCEMRLNFSNMEEDEIDKGITILGRLIREVI